MLLQRFTGSGFGPGWLPVVASSVGRTMSSPTFDLDASGSAAAGRPVTVADVRALKDLLARGNRSLSDEDRVDMLRALTELVCSAEAEMAAVAADFDASMRAKA